MSQMATTKTSKTATTTRKRTSTATKSRSKAKAPATPAQPEVNAALAAAKQAAGEAAAAAASAAETPEIEAGPQEAPATDAMLRKRGLISEVAARSGMKRGDAKAAVESALAVLGEAIADGRGLNLPGFGKLKVVRTKKQAKAHVFVTKLRQPFATPEGDGDDGPKDPLAEAAE